VFDARTLPNPYWEPALQPLSGRDPQVVEFLEAQPAVRELLEDISHFLERRIPLYLSHNRGYLTVAVGCTGGQHRSVFLVERLAAHFAAHYPDVVARHGSLRSSS
jgi:RNase adapter protein RapZ